MNLGDKTRDKEGENKKSSKMCKIINKNYMKKIKVIPFIIHESMFPDWAVSRVYLHNKQKLKKENYHLDNDRF